MEPADVGCRLARARFLDRGRAAAEGYEKGDGHRVARAEGHRCALCNGWTKSAVCDCRALGPERADLARCRRAPTSPVMRPGSGDVTEHVARSVPSARAAAMR